ncbi:MAG: hypothetical protein ABI477_19525, partial [Chryseolinea sp.]
WNTRFLKRGGEFAFYEFCLLTLADIVYKSRYILVRYTSQLAGENKTCENNHSMGLIHSLTRPLVEH